MTIAIIAGRPYTTETATEVAEWSNNYYPGDFNFCQERLYRTPKGAWFTCGSGGAASKYATSAYGGGWTGQNDVITPLSEHEAQAWLEQRGDVEAIGTYFGDNVEDA